MMRDHTPGPCGICRVRQFERNHYFHGKMLSPRDLFAEQTYVNEKRWLINRMVIGWGIVCGLKVTVEGDCLSVAPGLALDCCGREILVCERPRLTADVIAAELGVDVNASHGAQEPEQPRPYQPPAPASEDYRPSEPPPEGYEAQNAYPYPEYPQPEGIPWALCLEYRECGVEPVKTGAEHRHRQQGEYNRIRDSYQLTIRPRGEICTDDYGDDACPHQSPGRVMSLHQTVVESSHVCGECRDCECVLLATGTLLPAGAEPVRITLDSDSWRYTPVVYTNPTLGGLVRCFHGGLPHIVGMNWRPWDHYGPDEFLDRLAKEHLRVTFDQPMNEYSVRNPRNCRLSIYLSNENRCPVPLQIPVDHVDYEDCNATYYFDDDCIEQELRRACRRLRRPADVELVLHGSMIHSQSGRALDAELIHDFPTGNGVEGGEFVTYFTVAP